MFREIKTFRAAFLIAGRPNTSRVNSQNIKSLLVTLAFATAFWGCLPLHAQESESKNGKGDRSFESSATNQSELKVEKAVSDGDDRQREMPDAERGELSREQPVADGGTLRKEEPSVAPSSTLFSLPA